MAKGNLLLGTGTGKLGDVVVYRKSGKQQARVYVPKIGNPRSLAQSNQRMRLKPALRFYQSLDDILDHSWQGVKYGGPSYNFFMKQALKLANGPFVTKDTVDVIPGEYPVSRGSLVGARVSDIASKAYAVTSLIVDGTALAAKGDKLTLGDVSQQIINNNEFWREGDQLTFIQFREIDGRFYPEFGRFIINSSDDTSAFVDLPSGRLLRFAAVDEDKTSTFLEIGYGKSGADVGGIVAAAVIQSRLEDGVWKRSNSDMFVNTDALSAYYDDDAVIAALASYGYASAITLDSKWYLNSADVKGFYKYTKASIKHVYVDNVYTEATINPSYISTAILSDGTSRVAFTDDKGQAVSIDEHTGVVSGVTYTTASNSTATPLKGTDIPGVHDGKVKLMVLTEDIRAAWVAAGKPAKN